MAKSPHHERHRAQSLRRKASRGRTPLTPYEREWLAAYEAQHPPRRAKPLAELVADADEADAGLDAREPYEAPAVESTAAVEEPSSAEVEEVDPPEVSRARIEQALADAWDKLGKSYAHVTSLHERLSVRAVALLEQVADRQSEQEAQLVDALDRLTAARANAMELEAGGGGAEESSERQDHLEKLLLDVAGPELKQRLAGALARGAQ